MFPVVFVVPTVLLSSLCPPPSPVSGGATAGSGSCTWRRARRRRTADDRPAPGTASSASNASSGSGTPPGDHPDQAADRSGPTDSSVTGDSPQQTGIGTGTGGSTDTGGTPRAGPGPGPGRRRLRLAARTQDHPGRQGIGGGMTQVARCDRGEIWARLGTGAAIMIILLFLTIFCFLLPHCSFVMGS